MSTKISQLTSATDITASDLMQIVDVEDGVMAPSGTNKKITAQLLADDLAGIVSDGSIATSKLASGALPSGVTISSTNIVNGTIVDADINVSAAIAGSKISPSFTAPSVISVNSSSDALRITQTGTGNALVVEDSTSPDASPFIVDSSGHVGIGTTTPSQPLQVNGNVLIGATPTTQYSSLTVVGDSGIQASSPILNFVNAAGSTRFGYLLHSGTGGDSYLLNQENGSIRFGTNNSEGMRITSAGNVGISTTTPSSKLHVAGDLTMSSATVATSATAGTNGDVPAQVAGYLVVSINGTARKIPYYA